MPPNQFNQNTVPSPTIQNNTVLPNNTQQVMQQPTQNSTLVYAGFWIRFAAMLVDGIIFQTAFILVVVMIVIFAPNILDNELIKNIIVIVYSLSLFLYYVLSQSGAHQATIGKRLAGIKVVRSSDMSRISFGRSVGRELSKIVSYMTFMIGFLMAGFTAKKQALHDMMAGTLVVKEKPARVGAMLTIIFLPIILQVIVIVVMGGMFLSVLFNSVGTTDYSNNINKINLTESSVLDTKVSDNENEVSGKTKYDFDYDKVLFSTTMQEFELEKPGVYVGPAIIELHSDLESNPVYDIAEVFLPDLPNIEKANVVVLLTHIYNNKGIDVSDDKNAIETDDHYNNVDLIENTSSDGDVYYSGEKLIYYKGNNAPNSKTFGSAQGVLIIELPDSDGYLTYRKEYPFTINNK